MLTTFIDDTKPNQSAEQMLISLRQRAERPAVLRRSFDLPDANPYQYLLALVLAGQCPIPKASQIAIAICLHYPDLVSLAEAKTSELQPLLSETPHIKSKTLILLARQIVQHHDGQIPRDIASLEELPGVSNAGARMLCRKMFGLFDEADLDRIGTVAWRAGLLETSEPDMVETMLDLCVDAEVRTEFKLRLLDCADHCYFTSPYCGACPLKDVCPSANGGFRFGLLFKYCRCNFCAGSADESILTFP